MNPHVRIILGAFVDSAETSYRKIRERYERPNDSQAGSGQTPQGIPAEHKASTGAISPHCTEAIVACVVLGIKKSIAEHWAKLCPDQTNSGVIVAFVMRHR